MPSTKGGIHRLESLNVPPENSHGESSRCKRMATTTAFVMVLSCSIRCGPSGAETSSEKKPRSAEADSRPLHKGSTAPASNTLSSPKKVYAKSGRVLCKQLHCPLRCRQSPPRESRPKKALRKARCCPHNRFLRSNPAPTSASCVTVPYPS